MRLADYVESAGVLLGGLLLAAPPSPKLQSLLCQVAPALRAAVAAARAAAACASCMAATSRRAVLHSRGEVARAAAELVAARAAVRVAYLRWGEGEGRAFAGGWSPGDLRLLAGVEVTTLALREVSVVAVVLSEEEVALDRDQYWTWLSSWFGRRPLV